MFSTSLTATERGRISSLDGLRALAVLFPFAHAALGIPGAWMSADLFFVLSGFFLTSELRAHRKYFDYWKVFFLRRALRLIPPILVALLAAVLLFPIPTLADSGNAFARHAAHALCNLWSVAVIVHFCLLWPIVVKRLRRRQLMTVCFLLLVIEPIARQLAMIYFGSFRAVYYLTPFRLDSLAAGALLALCLENDYSAGSMKRWSGWAFATLALSLAALAPFGFLQRNAVGSLFNSLGYSWLAAMSFCLIAFLVLHPRGKLSRGLSWKPLASLGLVSYGFYLYHPAMIWLVDTLADRAHIPHWRSLALWSFGLSVAASWVSFHFYEMPIMSLGCRRMAPASARCLMTPTTASAITL